MNKRPESQKVLLFRRLRAFAEEHTYLSNDWIGETLKKEGHNFPANTLKHYLSDAVELGLVSDSGRGWYSLPGEPAVLDPADVRDLVNRLQTEFPLLEFSVWATTQLNPWMRHLFNHPLCFVSAPRENLDTLHEFLRQTGEDSMLNPRKPDLAGFVPSPRTVILRPALAKAPDEGPFMTPEQVLVDLCVERRLLPLLDEAEFRQLAMRMAFHNRLKMSRLIAYSKRKKVPVGALFKINTLSPIFGENRT